MCNQGRMISMIIPLWLSYPRVKGQRVPQGKAQRGERVTAPRFPVPYLFTPLGEVINQVEVGDV